MTNGPRILLLMCALFVPPLMACVSLPHHPATQPSQSASQAVSSEACGRGARIDINTASAEELERLPGIGRGLAARIVSYREQYGRFRRVEHLIMVRGIGDRRFRRLSPYISAE